MDILDLNRFYRNTVDDLKKRIPAQKAGSSHTQQKIDKKSKLYKVSQEFESLFIKQLLDSMRKTINKSGLLDGGYAEEIFEDMLYDNYAMKIAENGSFGLADTLYKQLNAFEQTPSDRGLF